MSLRMATSQAISSLGARTIVWNEPLYFWPPAPMNTPGSLMTQARNRMGLGASWDPAATCFLRKICKSDAKKMRINCALDVAHERLQF